MTISNLTREDWKTIQVALRQYEQTLSKLLTEVVVSDGLWQACSDELDAVLQAKEKVVHNASMDASDRPKRKAKIKALNQDD